QARSKLHGVESVVIRLRFIGRAVKHCRFRRRRTGQNRFNGLLLVFSLNILGESAVAEFIEFFRPMFRRIEPTKQFCRATKPFSVFGADVRKQPTAIRLPARRRAPPVTENRRQARCGPPASSSPSPSSWLVR